MMICNPISEAETTCLALRLMKSGANQAMLRIVFGDVRGQQLWIDNRDSQHPNVPPMDVVATCVNAILGTHPEAARTMCDVLLSREVITKSWYDQLI